MAAAANLFPGPLRCRLEGYVEGVRFRRRGNIDGGLRQGEFTLGVSQKIEGILGGERLLQRLRIGQPHILDCDAHQAGG